MSGTASAGEPRQGRRPGPEAGQDQTPAPALVFGPYRLDRVGARLLREGQHIDIAPKPWALLCHLAERAGQLVTKDQLLDGVWGHRFVSDSVLKTAINSLRVVLGEDARDPQWVHTVSRRGYRFSEAVETEVSGSATPGHPATPHMAAMPFGRPPVGNLPAETDVLLGRETAIGRLEQALGAHRLVTLTGPGGVGKTRLALAVAARQVAPSDGVWLLRLEALATADGVAGAVARMLGLSDAAGASADALARALAPLQVLLVLDNAEHLVDGLATLVARCLQAAPGLRLLLTSQRPLRVAGEQVLPLSPLALPDAAATPAEQRASPAVALLVRRAQAMQPAWSPALADVADLAAIAQVLEGLPLALELAGARLPLLGPAGVRERLGARLQLLTRGKADAPARHRTLRAALDWSISLLPEPVACVFDRLAVFAGGFSAEAAQAVMASTLPALDEWEVLDALELLREMALIVPAEPGGTAVALTLATPAPRLRLFDSVRMRATERLVASGAHASTLRAHRHWLLAMFNAADARQLDMAEAPWLVPLEPEIDNLQTAMDLGLAALAGDPAASQLAALVRAASQAELRAELAELTAASAAFCLRAGLRHAATGWLKAQMPQVAQLDGGLIPGVQARFELATAMFGAQGQLLPADALAAAGRAVDLLRELGQRRRLRYALYLWVALQLRHGQREVARQAIAEMHTLDDPQASVHEQRLLPWVETTLARDEGDVARYGAFWAGLHAESRARGDRIESWKAAWGLAQARYLEGRSDDAIAAMDEAVDDMRACGRLRANSMMAGQAVFMRLGRDASPLTVQRLREVVPMLQSDGLLSMSLSDALAWLPMWQGRLDDALRIQAWSDSRFAQGADHRHPISARLRAAFAEQLAGRTLPQAPLLDETAALRLALKPVEAD